MYVDTVTFDPRMIRHLLDIHGADHVVLGTDFPYDMGEEDPLGLINAVPGLTDAERTMITGGTAARLLGLTPR
jgi:aminocarboxymuconate-semialdehyde decarboxylase